MDMDIQHWVWICSLWIPGQTTSSLCSYYRLCERLEIRQEKFVIMNVLILYFPIISKRFLSQSRTFHGFRV
ncbi:hypothetical protein M0802_010357 [Mischocyttarus mexicanus]|nr:hypothetical protein M0802_010357 [Mischocyttarus mexicanus]